MEIPCGGFIKCLYRITLGNETEPTNANKKFKWANRNDEARGIIRMYISHDLRFHLQQIDKPNEALEKIESVFGKHNIIRAQQLENQVLTLSPSDFSCIEDYLSKFKTLKISCEECKINMDEECFIYLILSKLCSAYFVFVSTFYAMKEALGRAYKKPTLESFCDALIREQDYRILQPHCNEIIIRRDVKFDENLLACEPNSTCVPSLACEPSSAFVPSSACEPSSAFVPSYVLVSSSDDESEDENPPLPAHLPPDESIEPEPAPAPATPLPRWVRSTREETSDLVGDPSYQHRTRSQFQRASSLLAQVSETRDPETFAEASGHPDWDTTMNEEYCSLMENDTWDLVPLPKGRKLVKCKWVYRTKYASDGSVERHKARLVAKGFSQVEGIDHYNETFAHVAKMNSICLVLALVASHKWSSMIQI
jgi:hypothetical protein